LAASRRAISTTCTKAFCPGRDYLRMSAANWPDDDPRWRTAIYSNGNRRIIPSHRRRGSLQDSSGQQLF
jgi:hypothetical protein